LVFLRAEIQVPERLSIIESSPELTVQAPMTHERPNTHAKALRVNLDPALYGTFAEIGAGQEVARWFFRVGGAAGTVAKAMSAYDMVFSDAIYSHSDRYVSRARLRTMLEREYGLLIERLHSHRGATTGFFVFADTVATRCYSRKEDGHGWLGIRFQTAPLGPPSEITVHVRLTDSETEEQQEALGIIGVNLVHGALFQHAEPVALIASLLDNVTDRGEVDMIEFTGPAFAEVDNRLMSLERSGTRRSSLGSSWAYRLFANCSRSGTTAISRAASSSPSEGSSRTI
jgi:hypothetical protein